MVLGENAPRAAAPEPAAPAVPGQRTAARGAWSAPLVERIGAGDETLTIRGGISRPDAPAIGDSTVQVDQEKIRICGVFGGSDIATLRVCPEGRGWAGTHRAAHEVSAQVTRILDAFTASWMRSLMTPWKWIRDTAGSPTRPQST